MARVSRPVFKAMHRSLTFAGVDRRQFFVAVMLGVAGFNVLGSFWVGVLLFVVVYGVAWWTKDDPLFLTVALRAARMRSRYDAVAHDVVRLEVR